MLSLLAFAVLGQGEGYSKASLVLLSAVRAGEPVRAAVMIQSRPGWHTYWKNPGDAGQEPMPKWKLPTGWKASALGFPIPKVIKVAHSVSYGYDGIVFHPVTFTPPAALRSGQRIKLAGTLEWLVCSDEECLPVTQQIELEALVDGKSGPLENTSSMPAPRSLDAGAVLTSSGIVLSFRTIPGAADYYFFPASEGTLVHEDRQSVQVSDGQVKIILKISQFATGVPSRLRGLLSWTQNGKREGTDLDVRIRRVR